MQYHFRSIEKISAKFLQSEMCRMREHFTYSRCGKYWEEISRRTERQIRLNPEGSWYSSEISYAGTFSGCQFTRVRKTARFRKKLENIIFRLGLENLPNFVMREVFRESEDAFYSDQGRLANEVLIHYGFELFRAGIEANDIRSPDCYGKDLVDVGARNLTAKTLRDFNVFALIGGLVKNTDSVVEIGAGVGELARIFLTTGKAKRYFIVDIPPALAFSECLILSQFGADQVSLFDPNRAEIEPGKICYFLTPDQIDLLPDFDLGLNIASFGEMDLGIISDYIERLEAREFSDFISINQRLGKSNNPSKIGETEYSRLFSKHRIVRKSSFTSMRPLLKLPDDEPGKQGYQLLHFSRR